MVRPVSPFAAATLIPVPLLTLGGLFGGIFILAAVLYLTLLTAVLDRLIVTTGPQAAPGVEFPAADRLSELLVIAHMVLLPVGVAGLAGITGLGFWEGLGVLIAFGLYFGQVSNSNAHELIHRTNRRHFRMGKWVLISLLYGHHVTAHLRVHHRYVATPDDPNTAKLGESFYSFAGRAWVESFVAGWEIEKSMAELRGKALPWWKHPYAQYVGGGLAFLVFVTVVFGASGLIAYLMLCAYAQAQLLLSDYVQHYGLRRRKVDDETYEDVAPWHSWNAPHWFSGGLMLNATRHSEHHTHPARVYPELSIPDEVEGPRLPHSLPVMGAIALIPAFWFSKMNRRAEAWQTRIDEGAILRSRPLPPMPAEGSILDRITPPQREKTPRTGPAVEEAEDVTARVSAALAASGAAPSGAPDDAQSEVPETELESETAVLERPKAEVEEKPQKPEDDFGLSDELLQQLASTTPLPAEELTKSQPAKPRASRAPTPELWAEDELPDAQTGQAVESEAPAQTDDAAEAGPADETEARTDADAAAPELASIESAVAEVVAGSNKQKRRRRANFPDLEPADEAFDESQRGGIRALARGARLAARALPVVMLGVPPTRRREVVDERV